MAANRRQDNMPLYSAAATHLMHAADQGYTAMMPDAGRPPVGSQHEPTADAARERQPLTQMEYANQGARQNWMTAQTQPYLRASDEYRNEGLEVETQKSAAQQGMNSVLSSIIDAQGGGQWLGSLHQMNQSPEGRKAIAGVNKYGTNLLSGEFLKGFA